MAAIAFGCSALCGTFSLIMLYYVLEGSGVWWVDFSRLVSSVINGWCAINLFKSYRRIRGIK